MAGIGAGCRWYGERPRSAVACCAVTVSALVATAGLPSVATAQIACSYDLTAVIQAPPGPLQASPTFPTAISPNGQHVVGWFNFDTVGSPRPWYWSQTTGFIALPMPPGVTQASPADINNSRVLCGTGWNAAGSQRGFVYDMNTQQFAIILPAGGSHSGASAINELGTVCGTRNTVVNGNPQIAIAYFWNGGTISDLGLIDGQGHYGIDIADDGKVVIEAAYASIWDGSTVQSIGPIPGGETSSGQAIISGNTIVGSGFVAGTNFTLALPFRYAAGQMMVLPVLGGDYDRGTAGAINHAGTIVGACRHNVNPNQWRACVWQEGTVRNLNDLVVLPQIPLLRSAVGVSDDGRIICTASQASDNVGVILTPVMAMVGDTNCDDTVSINDLLNVLNTWGAADSIGDLNSDNTVNINDLLIVLNNWSP